MAALLVDGGSQAKVMNLVEVMTASRLEGAEGRLWRTVPRLLEPGPSNERGRAVVTLVESAEQNKNKRN